LFLQTFVLPTTTTLLPFLLNFLDSFHSWWDSWWSRHSESLALFAEWMLAPVCCLVLFCGYTCRLLILFHWYGIHFFSTITLSWLLLLYSSLEVRYCQSYTPSLALVFCNTGWALLGLFHVPMNFKISFSVSPNILVEYCGIVLNQ
jgi:hypothetical protein